MITHTMDENQNSSGRGFWRNLKRAGLILDAQDRKKILLVTATQILFGLLDLVGVAVVGMVSALIVRGINSEGPGNNVGKFLFTPL